MPIPKHLLQEALEAAQHAPSSKNTQCWKTLVINGAARDRLSAALCQAFDQGDFGKAEYEYMMDPVDPLLMHRARECGYKLFELKGINRSDREARLKHSRENYEFFNAPTMIIFHLPKNSKPGMFLDMGLYMQNVMLALKALGIDSCPQYSIARYPHVIRSCLHVAEDRLIVCGLSIGFMDAQAIVNSFIPTRLTLDQVVDWID